MVYYTQIISSFNNTKYTFFSFLAVVLLISAGCQTTDNTDSYSVEPASDTDEISEEAIDALGRALDDEYKARTTYDVVMAEFGEVRPFVNIREAEQKHIDSLLGLYDTYGLEGQKIRIPRMISQHLIQLMQHVQRV